MPNAYFIVRTTIALVLLALTNLAQAVDINDVQTQIFTPTCAVAGCHNGSQSPNLSAGQAFTNIVNVPSGQAPLLFYIEPGNPGDSYLVRKIQGTAGSQMPLGRSPLSGSLITLVRDWVLQGALEMEVDNADLDNTTLGRVYLMTNSASNNVTSLHIVNSSSNAQTFTGTLFNGDGDQLGNADTPLHVEIISPQGRLILTASELESLFFVGPWAGPAILEVRGTSSFDLMTKLTSPSGLISNTNCVRQNNVHNIGGLDAASFTYVRFINQGTAPIDNITGTLYDANGTVLGDAGTLLIESLNPKAAVWLNRNNLSALFNIDWNGEANLVVEVDEDLRLLNLNFVNGETFFNFSCYESAN